MPLQLEPQCPFQSHTKFSPEDFLVLIVNTLHYRDYQFKLSLHVLCSELHLNTIPWFILKTYRYLVINRCIPCPQHSTIRSIPSAPPSLHTVTSSGDRLCHVYKAVRSTLVFSLEERSKLFLLHSVRLELCFNPGPCWKSLSMELYGEKAKPILS